MAHSGILCETPISYPSCNDLQPVNGRQTQVYSSSTFSRKFVMIGASGQKKVLKVRYLLGSQKGSAAFCFPALAPLEPCTFVVIGGAGVLAANAAAEISATRSYPQGSPTDQVLCCLSPCRLSPPESKCSGGYPHVVDVHPLNAYLHVSHALSTKPWLCCHSFRTVQI